MTMAAALRALLLSSLYDTLSAISCMTYPSGVSMECADGVTKCIQTKLESTIGTACDAGGMCGMYADTADGECINVVGSGQLVICGTPGYTSEPTEATFAACPTTATALPGGVTSSPTPAPTPAVECMGAVTYDADATTGEGGTVEASSVYVCTSTGTVEAGTAGSMCLQRLYSDINGVTQGCDDNFCEGITERNACCTDASGTKSICVASSPSAVPGYAAFADCGAPCTPAAGSPGAAAGGAARSSEAALAAAALAGLAAAGAGLA